MNGDGALRVLVADDEAIARKRLLRLLTAFPDVVIAGECADAHEVLQRRSARSCSGSVSCSPC